MLTPGRFLMPGDLEGSPLLTFFPLATARRGRDATRHLASLLARRYESYKAHVVKPFFRDHFARLDRQIVLIDALAALNQGPAGLDDLSRCDGYCAGGVSARPRTRGPRASSAAASTASCSPRPRRIISTARATTGWRRCCARSPRAAIDAGGRQGRRRPRARASRRCARRARPKRRSVSDKLPCIVGTPLQGERVGGIVFDGKTETALFPGDLPADPGRADVRRCAGRQADARTRSAR